MLVVACVYKLESLALLFLDKVCVEQKAYNIALARTRSIQIIFQNRNNLPNHLKVVLPWDYRDGGSKIELLPWPSNK